MQIKSIDRRYDTLTKMVIKRDGRQVEYDGSKVIMAIKLALYNDGDGEIYESIADIIEEEIFSKLTSSDDPWTVEEISDEIEKRLVQFSLIDTAKSFIIHRHKRKEDRVIENKRLFIEDYKLAKNASTGSKFDSNANVECKNIATLSGELHKRENILLNRKLLTNKIKKLYGKELAEEYIRQLKEHEIYKHDETSIMPYCVAINMYPFLTKGLEKLGGHSNPPTHLQAFNGSFINLVFAVASQFAGAVATPEYLMYMDYFVRKEYGDDYYLNKDKIVVNSNRKRTIEKVIEDSFQQVVYSLNQPAAARSYQSIFWNISYFDKHYFESIFGNFVFPDFTKPKWESLDWLQKKFMKWFNQERTKKALTFPVETVALLTEDNDVKHKEYADFIAEMYSEGHSFFTYMSDSADSLSSCCFDGKQKILLKSSNGVHYITFEELANSSYDDYKKNMTIFHNGSWCKGKLIKTKANKLYKITTSNNKTIIVTKDHINPTLNGDVVAEKLTTNDYLEFNNIELNTYPEKDMKLTYEQGVLIGAYIGDGSIEIKKENHSPNINFSLNKDKYKKLIPILKTAMDQLNLSEKIVLRKPYNNVFPVSIISKGLNKFIRQWVKGKYCYEKELDLNCLSQSVDFRKGILDGYYITDGGNSNRIYTTSTKMAEQIEVLITSLGKVSIIDIVDRTDEAVVIRGQKFKRNFPLICIRWYENKNKRSMSNVYKVKNNSIYFKIKDIQEIEKEQEVYCFEMNDEEEPYFTLPNGIITHNCRLRNEISDNEFSFSLGAGGVATGSKSVITINVNRLVQNVYNEQLKGKMLSGHKEFEIISKAISEQVKKIHKYQIAYNELMKDNFKAGLLPVYDAGFISLDKQFLTIGINGAVEAAEFMGIDIKANDVDYKVFLESILKPIYDENKKAKTKEIMFNTEFVPAENLGVKHANWDKEDGYFVPRDVYNSYFYIVEDESTNLIDKFKLHGRDSIKYLDGGSALHANLDEHLTKDQYRQLLKVAAQNGCNYFTFNIPNTICNDCKNISKHRLSSCPKCDSTNLDYLTRIIGYLKRVSSFSVKRQEEESRRYYGEL